MDVAAVAVAVVAPGVAAVGPDATCGTAATTGGMAAVGSDAICGTATAAFVDVTAVAVHQNISIIDFKLFLALLLIRYRFCGYGGKKGASAFDG